jgi:UDP-GlcNAc:undecaprenyl-phosphate/decaprenyl-phosphate GlcNAc-1-phosphate transferase
MIYFIVAFILSISLTLIVKKVSLKLNITDNPDNNRHLHKNKTPLLGGVAIFLSFWLMLSYLVFFTDKIGSNLYPIQLLSVFIASLLLIIIGVADDIYNIKPLPRLIVSAIAVGIVIIGGVGLDGITNPLGGVLSLDFWKIDIIGWGTFFVIADLLVFFWILGMTHTTKILDGLDGLVTGIIAIGALMIFFLSSTTKFYQSDIRLVALILAAVCLGFLIFNFHPAKIFLGESGGLFLGFILGVLAIIAGGKIATTLLVMAIPILDLFFVIYRRFINKQPIFLGDRRHLHFKLIDSGMGHKKSVLILYSVAFIFGISTLILPSKLKLAVLILLFFSFIISIRLLNKRIKKKHHV